MVEGEKSPVIKAATNEYLLLAFRAVATFTGLATSIIGTLLMMWVNDIKASTKDVKDEIAELRRTSAADRLADAKALGLLTGQLAEIKGSVDAHRRRLDNNDGDIRTIWGRLTDMLQRMPQTRPEGR